MSFLAWFLFYFLVSSIVVVLWYWLKYRYWKIRKIRGPSPRMILGNMVLGEPLGETVRKLYNSTESEPFVGIYLFQRPALLVNNLILAKSIMVRDFSHFVDHGFRFREDTQPLIHHLFNVNGSKWKALRRKVSPAFSTSKMKYMFETMAECGEELNVYLRPEADIGSEIDIKEIMARFNTDVIVSCAFGIDSNCLKYPDAEFRTMGKKVFEMDFFRNLYLLLGLCAPGLLKFFDGKVVQDDVSEFFIKAVERTVKHREENGVTRNDLMQLLIRLKNNESIADDGTPTEAVSDESDVHLSTVELAALAFGFYGGGFETSSTALTYIFYELSKNPHVQTELIDEIDRTIQDCDGKITYDAIVNMTYMSQVIDETLRCHPLAPVAFRVCTQDYKIPNTDRIIEKDTIVLIPAVGYHMDPKIFPHPDRFDPDRFSPEQKATRDNFSFMPFGDGPRKCIGYRFALLQISIALVYVLKDYTVSVERGHVMEIDRNSLLLSPKNAFIKIAHRRR